MKPSRSLISVGLSTLVALLVASAPAVAQAGPSAMEAKHFHPKGKLPSTYTIELQNGLRKSLSFEDKRDLEEAKKGFITRAGLQADRGRGRQCRVGHG